MPKNKKSGVNQLTKLDTVPIQGGCNTVLETQQIPMGKFSMVQNMRDTYPGKKQRKGQRVQHPTADSTNTVMSMYQFNKTKIAESHFYAQMSDSDVLLSATAPPGIATTVFGAEAFSGTASPVPASWSTIRDVMLFSNGVDQHQIYYGSLTYVERFIHYKSDDVPPSIPEIGYDYSDEASDGRTTTVVVLDGMLVYESCVFICCPVKADGLKFTVSAANGNAATATLYYMKSTGVWTELTSGTHTWVDGTITVATKTLSGTGTMSWVGSSVVDEIPSYMYGQAGYWYQLRVSATLDAEVELTSVQFTAPWQSIENIWDGVPVPVIEAVFHVGDVYKTYGATSIEIDSMAATDEVYLSSSDPISAIYVNVGGKPNSTATTTVDAVYYWNGIAFASVGTISDGTVGLSQSGWITFPRVTSHKTQFNKNQYYAYWYYFTVDKTLNDDVIISVSTQPYFDADKFGKGYCNTAWKGRAVYGTDVDQYFYVSALGRPQVLNGQDFGPLEPGDGRSNLPVAMRPFHNELMVWQEEKGKEGGCLTLFEGLSPPTWGRLVLSTKIGTLSSKTVAIVDGVYTSTKTDEVIGMTAYFLSHYGVFISDGRYVTGISDDIQNYFDPLESECIRRGYEDQMWLSHDTAHNVIRIGLVSGSSATTCNIFPVYDIATKTWGFDSFEQKPSCMTEVEAGSGSINIIQMVGGTGDGFIYQSNYGDNDVSTAIDSYIDIELNADGQELDLEEMVLTAKTGTGVTITPTVDGTDGTAITETSLSNVRNKYSMNSKGMDMKVRIQNNTASESLHLFGIGMKIYSNTER